MRGSLAQLVAYMGTPGIIPAHAGLTMQGLPLSIEAGDHPRACGAHSWRTDASTCSTGSSPRMRGSLRFYPNVASTIGIIPAHAGLTISSLICRQPLWDHPRACGAHADPQGDLLIVSGSSPRMRGSLPSKYRLSRPEGIIPAHAGLTSRCRSCRRP